jgi:hypothetical protein
VSDNEHTAAALGHSEVLSVKHPVAPPVPEVGQDSEDDAHVPSFVRRQKARDVLDENPTGSELTSETHELVEQSAPLASQASTASSHAEVLAGESSAENIDCWDAVATGACSRAPTISVGAVSPMWTRADIGSDWAGSFGMKLLHVVVGGYVGPVVREDCAGVLVDLALPHDVHPGTLEAEVETADPTEQRADVHAAPSSAAQSYNRDTTRNAGSSTPSHTPLRASHTSLYEPSTT